MTKKTKKAESPFPSSEEWTAHFIKIALLAPDLSPQMLSDATGVSLNTCINFMSEAFASCMIPDEQRP